MPEPIREQLKLDGVDEVVAGLDATARAEQKLATETKKAGDAADGASRQHERQHEKVTESTTGMEGLSGAIGSQLTKWLSWAAVLKIVMSGLEDIIVTAKKATDAFAETGRAAESLALNIGGDRADQTFNRANELARPRRIGVPGRDSLIGFASAKTDVSDVSQTELEASLALAADLYKATGQGGADVFKAVAAVQESFGVTEQQAFGMSAKALNGGFSASALYDVATKSQNKNTLALYLASQKYGMDASLTARASGFEETINRRDEQGKLVPELQALGITDGMDQAQRIAAINQAIASGQANEGQVLHAIGGDSNKKFFTAQSKAVSSGAYSAMVGELGVATMQAEIDRAADSQRVQAYYRDRDRKFREQVATEESTLSDLGERMAEHETELKETGGGSWWAGLWNTAAAASEGNMGLTPTAPPSMRRDWGGGGGGQPTIINNHNEHYTNYHAPVHPSLLDSAQREQH